MKTKFDTRKLRTRSKLLKLRPRLSVYKSNRYIDAQIIDDIKGITLASVSSKSLGKIGKLGKKGIDTAKEVGIKLAEKAKLKKVKSIVFDKGGYQYHGKIKAVAEGAREGGLEF
ncbi:MAG TPA: 50S ribosomal protein L18 [Patescibacteria group bacterium]|nr:50S ribosomal protein L18 [Patescibacteria group bacterium]